MMRLTITLARSARVTFLTSAGLGLAGCASLEPAPPAGRVTVAPGIVFDLPSPGTLGRSVEASQLITARYEKQTFVFETRISVTPARLLATGFDPLGRRAMTIEWTGRALTAETAPWVPAGPHVANVIADIMLAHWPASAVRAGLAPGCELHETSPGRRTITAAGRDMIRIDRTVGSPANWSGRWSYQNLGWGYGLDIQSAEAAP